MPATISLPLLDRAQVAAPCPARWSDMPGDDKIRHCVLCNLNVHNFAAMTPTEAESLLARHFHADGSPVAGAGRLCGMLFRRDDGTYLLEDCPVGIAALKAKVRRAWMRLAAAIGLVSSVAAVAGMKEQGRTPRVSTSRSGAVGISSLDSVPLKDAEPFQSAWELIQPTPLQVRTRTPMPGEIMVRPVRGQE